MTLNSHTHIDNYVIIASLKSEPMGKLINRIPSLHFLMSSSAGPASRSLAIQQVFSKPCLVNLISKDAHLAFYFQMILHECPCFIDVLNEMRLAAHLSLLHNKFDNTNYYNWSTNVRFCLSIDINVF